jgi:hypothetical protein
MRRLHVAAAQRARRVIHDENYALKNTRREWVDRRSGREGLAKLPRDRGAKPSGEQEARTALPNSDSRTCNVAAVVWLNDFKRFLSCTARRKPPGYSQKEVAVQLTNFG